jgi:hypothetical protein
MQDPAHPPSGVPAKKAKQTEPVFPLAAKTEKRGRISPVEINAVLVKIRCLSGSISGGSETASVTLLMLEKTRNSSTDRGTHILL